MAQQKKPDAEVAVLEKEVSQDLARERIERFWRQYGRVLAVVLGIGVLVLAGGGAWEYYRTQQQEKQFALLYEGLKALEKEDYAAAAGFFASIEGGRATQYGAMAELAQGYAAARQDDLLQPREHFLKAAEMSHDPLLTALAEAKAGAYGAEVNNEEFPGLQQQKALAEALSRDDKEELRILLDQAAAMDTLPAMMEEWTRDLQRAAGLPPAPVLSQGVEGESEDAPQ